MNFCRFTVFIILYATVKGQDKGLSNFITTSSLAPSQHMLPMPVLPLFQAIKRCQFMCMAKSTWVDPEIH